MYVLYVATSGTTVLWSYLSCSTIGQLLRCLKNSLKINCGYVMASTTKDASFVLLDEGMNLYMSVAMV